MTTFASTRQASAQALLKRLFDAAIASAQPALCLPPHLPTPESLGKGRLIVIGAGKASAAMDEARLRQQAIGVRLRQMFDEVVNEAVPDEFLDILRRADNRASGKD